VEKPWTASKHSKNGTVHSFVHRAWKTGERMPVFHERQQAGGASSRGVRSVSLSKRTEHTTDSQTLATQSTRPLNRGRFTWASDEFRKRAWWQSAKRATHVRICVVWLRRLGLVNKDFDQLTPRLLLCGADGLFNCPNRFQSALG
jgi:hypothetical protein